MRSRARCSRDAQHSLVRQSLLQRASAIERGEVLQAGVFEKDRSAMLGERQSEQTATKASACCTQLELVLPSLLHAAEAHLVISMPSMFGHHFIFQSLGARSIQQCVELLRFAHRDGIFEQFSGGLDIELARLEETPHNAIAAKEILDQRWAQKRATTVDSAIEWVAQFTVRTQSADSKPQLAGSQHTGKSALQCPDASRSRHRAGGAFGW